MIEFLFSKESLILFSVHIVLFLLSLRSIKKKKRVLQKENAQLTNEKTLLEGKVNYYKKLLANK